MAWKERDFEEKLHGHVDWIYKVEFPSIADVERIERDATGDRLLMDKCLGIDTLLHFDNGSVVTVQEKCRRHKWLRHDELTFEYYNDPARSIKGEWFHNVAQLLFYGYANQVGNGIKKYYILKMFPLRMFLNDGGKEHLRMLQNWPPAKSNFYTIPFNSIPLHCFWSRGEPRGHVTFHDEEDLPLLHEFW